MQRIFRSSVPSLGVHEHWNNAADKQNSRNLGVSQGIELISFPPHLRGAHGDIGAAAGGAEPVAGLSAHPGGLGSHGVRQKGAGRR
jgi:hypothetical protein